MTTKMTKWKEEKKQKKRKQGRKMKKQRLIIRTTGSTQFQKHERGRIARFTLF